MLDISDFRDNANVIKADHDKRGLPHDNINEVIRLDEESGELFSLAALPRETAEVGIG